MKNQVLFSSKDISKKLKCRLQQLLFLFGALRVNSFLLFSLQCVSDFSSPNVCTTKTGFLK